MSLVVLHLHPSANFNKRKVIFQAQKFKEIPIFAWDTLEMGWKTHYTPVSALLRPFL
jgi:hypothetical protein